MRYFFLGNDSVMFIVSKVIKNLILNFKYSFLVKRCYSMSSKGIVCHGGIKVNITEKYSWSAKQKENATHILYILAQNESVKVPLACHSKI